MIKLRLPTSAHWYTHKGEPCYEVPCKSRPGEMRPTTLRDARKMNLVPSVTSILAVVRKPALEDWRMRSLLEEAVTVKRNDTESDTEYIDRIINGYRQNTEMARDYGTACHIAVEDLILSGVRTYAVMGFDTSIAVGTFIDFESKTKIKIIESEKPFSCSVGYGGKVDIIGDIYNVFGEMQGQRYIIDMKFKETSEDKMLPVKLKDLYDDDYGLQLAAYAYGLGYFKENPNNVKLANLFISVNEPGKYTVILWEEYVKLFNSFCNRFKVWKDINNYNPEMEARGTECESKTELAENTGQVD
jgi:hypothetical protein